MKSLLSFLLLCLALTLPGCGNIFIRGALPAFDSRAQIPFFGYEYLLPD